jgi:hypothetical protein
MCQLEGMTAHKYGLAIAADIELASWLLWAIRQGEYERSRQWLRRLLLEVQT